MRPGRRLDSNDWIGREGCGVEGGEGEEGGVVG